MFQAIRYAHRHAEKNRVTAVTVPVHHHHVRSAYGDSLLPGKVLSTALDVALPGGRRFCEEPLIQLQHRRHLRVDAGEGEARVDGAFVAGEEVVAEEGDVERVLAL